MQRFLAPVAGVLLVLAGLVPGSPAWATGPTTVGGIISEDTTWTVENSPYEISSPVVVPAGVTLTIDPGVTVSRASTATSLDTMFRVSGTVRAVGTAVDPVAFTGGSTPILGAPPGTTMAGAAGVVEFVHVKVTGPRLIATSTTSTWAANGALAVFQLRDSHVQTPNEYLKLRMVRSISMIRNNVVLGTNTTNDIEFGAGHQSVRFEANRLRGVRVACYGDALQLRGNTFEYMSSDAWEDGSGLVARPGCAGIDARENHWETSGDLGTRIYDGMDAAGLPIADTADRLDTPAEGTPILPPAYFSSYLQIRAYPTGLTSWWAGGSSGGAPVTYKVEALREGVWEAERVLETPGGSVAFRNLDTATRYRIRVTPFNAAGAGYSIQSEAIYPVATAQIPGAPGLQLNLIRRGANMYWWGTTDGGMSIDYYQWLLEDTEGVIEGSGGSSTSATWANLMPGKTYRFSVYAVNQIGPGPATVREFIATDVPSAPRRVRARAQSKAALVTWRKPATNNGAVLTGYEVQVFPTRRLFTVPRDTLQLRIGRLKRTTNYQFRVRALNALGRSVQATSPKVVPK
jgi:hypothetical protein